MYDAECVTMENEVYVGQCLTMEVNKKYDNWCIPYYIADEGKSMLGKT